MHRRAGRGGVHRRGLTTAPLRARAARAASLCAAGPVRLLTALFNAPARRAVRARCRSTRSARCTRRGPRTRSRTPTRSAT